MKRGKKQKTNNALTAGLVLAVLLIVVFLIYKVAQNSEIENPNSNNLPQVTSDSNKSQKDTRVETAVVAGSFLSLENNTLKIQAEDGSEKTLIAQGSVSIYRIEDGKIFKESLSSLEISDSLTIEYDVASGEVISIRIQ